MPPLTGMTPMRQQYCMLIFADLHASQSVGKRRPHCSFEASENEIKGKQGRAPESKGEQLRLAQRPDLKHGNKGEQTRLKESNGEQRRAKGAKESSFSVAQRADEALHYSTKNAQLTA